LHNLTRTDDLRIRDIAELIAPVDLVRGLPATDAVLDLVTESRAAIRNILHGTDRRLLVVIGPCSIHDPASALEYASRLQRERMRLGDALEIVMRVYFEKPRTTIGWKGLINDPFMDDSFAINEGLRIARGVLLDINALSLPTGTEFLDTITPQYIADLIAWGAIGARTTESQVHRELASGLSCPVGFKNGTDGNIQIAIDALKAANHPHHFLSVTKSGRSAIVTTAGNDDCHIILRGGASPNYDAAHVAAACAELSATGLRSAIMIDASHGNSSKNYENQPLVCADVAGQIARGEQRIAGVMIESHLVAGRQEMRPGKPLIYGQSVTDACLGWEASVGVLEGLHAAVTAGRDLALGIAAPA
jgi:3-deoxy-7-phosphoheptulonate synthase